MGCPCKAHEKVRDTRNCGVQSSYILGKLVESTLLLRGGASREREGMGIR